MGRSAAALALTLLLPTVVAGQANVPVPRADRNSQLAHEQLVAKAARGRIDVYFAGDSITRRWGATDYPDLLAHWTQTFFGWNAGNFGWGADRVENILWRLENGELDRVNPKVIVLLAGTNNVGGTKPENEDALVDDVVAGLTAVVRTMRVKAPNAVIVVTAIFPRSASDSLAVMPAIDRINRRLAGLADGSTIRFLNINDRLADASGRLYDGLMRDGLHPTLKGYQVWADALTPILTGLLGERAKEDSAPPPTGDPSATPR